MYPRDIVTPDRLRHENRGTLENEYDMGSHALITLAFVCLCVSVFLCVCAVQVFSFRFVTVFASLYHYAFVSRQGTANYKLLRLAASLCSFMTIGQWWYMVGGCYWAVLLLWCSSVFFCCFSSIYIVLVGMVSCFTCSESMCGSVQDRYVAGCCAVGFWVSLVKGVSVLVWWLPGIRWGDAVTWTNRWEKAVYSEGGCQYKGLHPSSVIL